MKLLNQLIDRLKPGERSGEEPTFPRPHTPEGIDHDYREHLGVVYPQPGEWYMNYIGPKSVHWYYNPPRQENGLINIDSDWSNCSTAHLRGDRAEPNETVELTVDGERVFVVSIEHRDIPHLAQTDWPPNPLWSSVEPALIAHHLEGDPTSIDRPTIPGEIQRLGLA